MPVQVSVLEEISRGEVLLAVARRCLKLMQDFVDTLKVLAEPGAVAAAAAAAAAAASGDPAAPRPQELGFEMVCALVNNSVDCYNQSLEFTEHVQVRRDGLPSAASPCCLLGVTIAAEARPLWCAAASNLFGCI